jgi:tetratricopeptide (TPR) repeat protein
VRQGTWYFHQITREAVWRARELFREALKIDPQLPEAHIWLGRVTGALVAYGWSDDRIADLKEGSHAALKAVQLDEQNPYSHYALAVTSVFSGAPGRAILAAETAIKLSPSFALGYLALGFAHLNLGRATDARPRRVVVRKQLRRGQVIAFFAALPPCLIGMEACATAHYWARELTRLGHEVRLMPAKDVKAYVTVCPSTEEQATTTPRCSRSGTTIIASRSHQTKGRRLPCRLRFNTRLNESAL